MRYGQRSSPMLRDYCDLDWECDLEHATKFLVNEFDIRL